MQWNCENIKTALELLPPEDTKYYHLIVLTETWATRATALRGFYTAESLASTPEGRGRPSGGVVVLYNSQLGSMECLHNKDDSVVLTGESINVIAMYSRPSVEPTALLEQILFCLDQVDLLRPTVLCGDFNCAVDKPSLRKTRQQVYNQPLLHESSAAESEISGPI